MAPRNNKRKALEPNFDPNASDPEDKNYTEEPTTTRKTQKPKKGKGKKTTKAAKKAKPAKRQRREEYENSDDDDEVEMGATSEEASFQGSSEEPEEAETNPVTGRAVRAVAKKAVKYEEVSEGEGEEEAEEEEEEEEVEVARSEKEASEPHESPKKTAAIAPSVPASRAGLIKLIVRPEGLLRILGSAPVPQGMMTRRSSRISQDREEPLVALGDSGKHAKTTRAGSKSNTPDPGALKRPTKGGKGMKKPPSTITEEQSQLEEPATGVAAQDIFSQLEEEQNAEQSDHVIAESEKAVSEGPQSEEPPVPPKRKAARKEVDQSSDYNPGEDAAEAGEGDLSDDSEDGKPATRTRKSSGELSSASGKKRSAKSSQRGQSQQAEDEADDDEVDRDEVADEAAELAADAGRNQRSTRGGKRKAEEMEDSQQIDYASKRGRRNLPARNYQIRLVPDAEGEDEQAAPTASQPTRGSTKGRTLFSTAGPFGGMEDRAQPVGGDDSDSSDEEGGGMQNAGGSAGMTPASGIPKPHRGNNPLTGAGGGPPALGRIKDKKALADADPLGVDANVSFAGVGGLESHVDSLKEMAMMPLLYPEIFAERGITPPRGVLFHGPPGTGKTHLARALSNSVSSEGKKVTFYMRKGADALSKWVGEAEKQLRTLFEEARRNQPSIIFFDEIDGLAPVRSSKQEQIHSSIVATLLALMDGMDGRGQVIVIGATNRPDSVDPALRRPGRFDREFYFPLPDVPARREIIEINTKSWQPPIQPEFKDQLADLTRGYSGADLRALCTEAALNAVKRTYPQIYKSNQKLLIDSKKIQVSAKDFTISLNKMVPTAERSVASRAAPLKTDVDPLLREPLKQVVDHVDNVMPRKRKATALEEAMYEDATDNDGFDKETMLRHFERSRMFRPRLLIKGYRGMGQQYLGAAVLSKLEGVHVQSFELATVLNEPGSTAEAVIVQKFEEIQRNKPSVIYLPNVNAWYRTMPEPAIRLFTGLLNSLPPTDPVLVLGVLELDYLEKPDPAMLRDLFGYSRKSQYLLARPKEPARRDFFTPIVDYIRKAPSEFPAPENRKKRKLEELPVAPPPPPAPVIPPSKEEQKAQRKADHYTLNQLKISLQPIMDQIKLKYRKFRSPAIPEASISYLFDDDDPEVLTTDLRQRDPETRPFERDTDEKGVPGLRHVLSGRFFYNLEIITIEKRLSNGYYKRPKDFLADIKRLAKDAKNLEADDDRELKAAELQTNVEVDMMTLEQQSPALLEECEALYERELQRERDQFARANAAKPAGERAPKIVSNVPPPGTSATTAESSGPIVLGQQFPEALPRLAPTTPNRSGHSNSTSNNTGAGTDASHGTNGSTVPSRAQGENTEMMDSQQDPFSTAHSQAHAARLQQESTQGQRSQHSAHTQLQPGSQLGDYHNSASTTTSGQKTSDRSSGPFTQYSNGIGGYHGPDFTGIPSASGGSQLPDTQDPAQYGGSSQPSSQHRASSISALLNEPAETANGTTTAANSAMPPPSRYILDQNSLNLFHDELTLRSSGLSVEQLEQVNASLMSALWAGRGEWNRNQVMWGLKRAFEEEVQEIEACQRVMRASQEEAGDDEDVVMGGMESGFGL